MIRLPVLVAGIALASACMTPQRTQPLREVVRSYNDGVRWQRFNLAAAHVAASSRDDFLDRRDQLSEDLRISDYEIIRVRYDDAQHQARVHIKFTWHLDSRGVVHTTHVVQSWQHSKKTWILAGEKHLRGEPMPGVEPRQPRSQDRAMGQAAIPGTDDALRLDGK